MRCSGVSISVNGYLAKKINYNNNVVCSVDYANDTIYCMGVAIKNLPLKQTYTAGEVLDSTGLIIYANYDQENVRIIKDGFTCSPTRLITQGTQTITVTYGEQTTTFSVVVKAPVLVSISVKNNPTKMEYCQGDTVNISGLTINAIYSNGKTEEISSGFSYSPTTITSNTGTQAINITYSGKTTTLNVNVPYVNYTYPNSSKHHDNSNTKYGIKVIGSRVLWGDTSNYGHYHAFDNNSGTICLMGGSSSDYITVQFPFSINLKSVTITNPASNEWAMRRCYLYSAVTGNEKTWPTMLSNTVLNSGQGVSTTLNPTANTSGIYYVQVYGSVWQTSERHGIAEIKINFIAKRSDLVSAGLL